MTNHDALQIMKHTEITMTAHMKHCQLNPEDHEELCHRVYEKLMAILWKFDDAKASLVTYANACVNVLVKKVCAERIRELNHSRHHIAPEDCSLLLERTLQQQRRIALQKAQLAQRLANAIDALEPKHRLLALLLKENPKLTVKSLAETFCMDYDLFHHSIWRKFCQALTEALAKNDPIILQNDRLKFSNERVISRFDPVKFGH